MKTQAPGRILTIAGVLIPAVLVVGFVAVSIGGTNGLPGWLSLTVAAGFILGLAILLVFVAAPIGLAMTGQDTWPRRYLRPAVLWITEPFRRMDREMLNASPADRRRIERRQHFLFGCYVAGAFLVLLSAWAALHTLAGWVGGVLTGI
ncbi:MAG: hypothetical protein SFU53_05655 [Terrimicrobiaceae bacterium]|nr:hypothetical protein [Terrimicrobiaceae bacterium]